MKNLLLPGLICWLLGAFLLPSCVRDVVMDAHEKPQVVVVCILSDEAEQTLQLYFTKGASLAEAPALTEASVALLDDDGLVGHFQWKQGREWTLAYKARPGMHYKLKVEIPGYDLITAEQTMPKVAKVIAKGWFPYRIQGLNLPSGMPEAPPFVPNEEDFESLPLGTKSYYMMDIPDPIWIFAMNYDPEKKRHSIAEEICTECPFVDPFNNTGTTYIPPERSDVPNPYVEGSHVAKLAPLLENMPLHKRYLRFSACDLSSNKGWWFMVSGSLQGKYNCKNFYRSYYNAYGWENGLADPLQPDEGYLEVTAVSEDLDLYMLESYEYLQLRELSDLSLIYIRDNLFSNIKGGVGLFGCKCSRKYQWSGEFDYIDDGMVHSYRSGAGAYDRNGYYEEENWSEMGIE